jgi:hypothetical protein
MMWLRSRYQKESYEIFRRHLARHCKLFYDINFELKCNGKPKIGIYQAIIKMRVKKNVYRIGMVIDLQMSMKPNIRVPILV